MFWSNIVKKRELKRLGCLKKFVFLEQLRLIRWGERLFRNCLGTWIGIEEMDKDLQKPQGKIWFLICICHGVRIGLYNWNFWNQILLKLFPFTKKDNKSLIYCFFSYFLCLMPWYLKFFHWGRLGVLGVLPSLDIERGASELLFVLFREMSCLWESR